MVVYRVIGVMSGSSLDGLDLAYCEFNETEGAWEFRILKAETIPFEEEILQDLKHLPVAYAKDFWMTHAELGRYFGLSVSRFVKKYKLKDKVDFVASHGHTVFHFPEKGFTCQVGDGAAIAAHCGLKVVSDFRSSDLALGGQGTPIVPIGDLLLFADYTLCLNLGGISNISCKTKSGIIAFDICPVNQVLNFYANKLNLDYDHAGKLARSGKLSEDLLHRLNSSEYLNLSYPKSLDNSFSREVIQHIIEETAIDVESKLRTYVEHVAIQVAEHIRMISRKEKLRFGAKDRMLITGGGAYNSFLIERIGFHCKMEIVVPGADILKFKEALVIAFMGVLRMRSEVNVLQSVTGAEKNSIGGAVYLP